MRDSALNALTSGAGLADTLQQTLLRLGILVADPEQEVREMVNFFDRLDNTQSVFNALIVLNLDCNLACTYCYEHNVKAKQYITPAAVDAFIEHVKTLDFSVMREVVIDFYGGEPLLSVDTIVYISEKLRKTGERLGFEYSFRLVTNGTLLTPKTVERLVGMGLKGAKITLDGPEESHNRTRPFVSGSGSFARIITNLRDVCNMIDIQIGGNYTVDSYGRFPLLLDDLAEKGITPDKVAVVKFDPVAETDGKANGPPELGAGCASVNEEWLIEASIFLREEILKRGYKTAKITPLTCVVELAEDIVLNVDGSLYKCPGMLGRKEFAVGTIQDGIIDYHRIYNLGHWKNSECLECAYLPLCFGGCRFMNMLRTGSIAGIDCRKPYFDATLEAFIKQEIKYKDRLVGPKSAPSPKP